MKNSPRPGGSIHTDSPPWDSSWPRLLDDDEQRSVWAYWGERFGIPPEVQRSYTLWERGRMYWALSASSYALEGLSSLKVVSVGIPLMRKIRQRLKPTTSGLRLLSKWVLRHRIRLPESEVTQLLINGEIPWTDEVSEGYVLLETEGGVLGCGFLQRGKLRSQIPKSETAALLASKTQGTCR